VGSDNTPIKKTEEKKTRPTWKENKTGGAYKKTEGFTPCHCEIRAFFSRSDEE
jgi:hypothetical protein